RLIEANDGGANVSFNGGKTWSDQDYATAQFYHVTTTNHFPYRVCGAQQDNSGVCGPSRWPVGIDRGQWYDLAGEGGQVEERPVGRADHPRPDDRRVLRHDFRARRVAARERADLDGLG